MRALSLLVLVAACTREWVRPYDGVVPGGEHANAALFVRDYLTGKPVPRARVAQRVEWAMSRDGAWAPLVAESHTDEFGLVTFPVPADAPNCHWTIHAARLAPTETYGKEPEEEIELRPPRRYAGRVLGIDGRPLVGALVEWKVGCAHSPSLAGARTDETGLFVLDGIDEDGEFVLEGPPGVERYVAASRSPWPVRVSQVLPNRTIRGRVTRSDGIPPEWAVVCGSSRAPRAVADRDGVFTLPGVTGRTLWVWWDGGLEEIQGDFAPGIDAVLVVGADTPEPGFVRVAVDLRDGAGAAPPVALPLHFDRLEDGRRLNFEWSPWGTDGDPVAPGEYRVTAGDSWSAYVSDPKTVRVTEDQTIDLIVRPQPTLSFELPGIQEGAPVGCRIVLEEGSLEVDPRDEPPHLPATGRAWLRVDLGAAPYTFEIGPERDGVRRADVKLPGPKFVRVPGLDEDGFSAQLLGEDAPIVGGLEPRDIEDAPNGLLTYSAGERQLALAHQEKGWAIIRLDLPFESATIEPDCTLTPWPKPEDLRVLADDGRPVPGAEVTVLDEDAPPGVPFVPDEPSETDGDGVLRRRWLRDGLHVRIDREGRVPSWTKLSGSAPYEVRVGSAVLEIEVAGVESARAMLDGTVVHAEDGKIVFSGVAAGAHALVVCADGRNGVAYGLILRQGETRRLRPTLRQ